MTLHHPSWFALAVAAWSCDSATAIRVPTSEGDDAISDVPVEIPSADLGGLDVDSDVAALFDTESDDDVVHDVAGEDAGGTDDGAPDAGPTCLPATAATATPETGCGLGNEPAPPASAVVVDCPGGSVSWSAAGGLVRGRYVQTGQAAWETGAVVASSDTLGIGAACDGTRVVCTDQLVVVLDDACGFEARDASGTAITTGAFADTPAGPRLQVAAEPGEGIYGLGPKTGPLNRNGRAYTLWNTDAYDPEFGGYAPDADPLYQSIPVVLVRRSVGTHGLFVDGAGRQRWDFSGGSSWWAESNGHALDVWVLPGPRPSDVLDRYTRLTGRPAMPPRWAFGYHQSRWGWTDAATVDTVGARFRSESIPCESLWFDIQKMADFRSFTWNSGLFPSPVSQLTALGALGFRTVAIVDPALKVDSTWDVYAAGLDLGAYLIDPATGTPYVGEVWPGPSVFPDFTNPAVRAWWASLVPKETALGIDGLWIDMNEPTDFAGPGGTVPDTLAVHGDGQGGTMADAHNVYALREAEATRAGLAAALPERRPFLLTRAGYAGIQRAAMAWTGDAPSRPDILAGSLPMLLGMGLSGTPFVGTDVGGYSGTTDPALFVRWMAFGSISPFFRGHAEKSAPPSMPWDFGTEARDISRRLIEARYRLLPTWYALADEARRTGAPILRPLFWAFDGMDDIDDQALIGDDLLVAPFLEPAASERTVVFPPGRWFDVASGAVVDGPTTRVVRGTLAALPMWAREGAVVVRGPLQQFDGDVVGGPRELTVYPPRPGLPATSRVLYDDAGDGPENSPYRRTRLLLTGHDGGMTLEATLEPGSTWTPPARDLVVRIQRVDAAPTSITLDGAAVSPIPDASAAYGWHWDPVDLTLVVRFPDAGAFALSATYPRALSEAAPLVAVPFTVTVPPGTFGTLHLAHSANGWAHVAMKPGGAPGTWTGTALVPRGEWFEYKYTRGGWDSVEKWPGCVEAKNRYAYGAAHPDHVTSGVFALNDPGKRDTVYAWADICL